MPNENGGDKQVTVRQTIVETIEAPRLQDIATKDFVEFRDKRDTYKRRVAEKNQDAATKIPLTTLVDSIDKSILELFVLAGWVPVDDVENITDQHLEACVEDRSHVSPADYDLAKIERELQDIKLARANATNNLQRQVWRLCLKYHEKLKNCGYDQFVKQQPKIAVWHVMKRINTHQGLRKRMMLTLRLRKKELEKNFSLFMRELSNEAQAIDRHESAQGYKDEEFDSDREESTSVGSSRKRKRQYGGGKGAKHDVTSGEGPNKKGSGSKEKKKHKSGPPPCLLPRCDGEHLISACPIATDQEKKNCLDEYYEKKRQKGDGNARRNRERSSTIAAIHGAKQHAETSSLFTAEFCDGALEAMVLADQGSHTNIIPPELLANVMKSDKTVKVINLSKPVKFSNALPSARLITCSREVQLDVQLRIRHGEKLMLRNVKWLVSDDALAHAYVGMHILTALGLDNRVMLAAARDRLGSVVDVAELLQRAGLEDAAYTDVSSDPTGSIGSLLRNRGYEWGSTYHSSAGTESDRLEDSDVYVDLGEDCPEKLTAAITEMVTQAKGNGLSATGTTRLEGLLSTYKSIFGCGWENPLQPTLNQ